MSWESTPAFRYEQSDVANISLCTGSCVCLSVSLSLSLARARSLCHADFAFWGVLWWAWVALMYW